MNKQATTLQIKQEFSFNAKGEKELYRLIIYDDDIVYDVKVGGKGPLQLGVMGRDSSGVLDEIAFKSESEIGSDQYNLPRYRATVYNNRHAGGEQEAMKVLVHHADGTVRGGLVFPKDEEKSFSIFFNQNRWASFLLMPKGVKYIQKENMDMLRAHKMMGSQQSDQNWPIEIDGQTTYPVTFLDVPASEWRLGTSLICANEAEPQTEENLSVRKMQVLGELSKLALSDQYKVLDQCAQLIRQNARERGGKQ